MDIAIMSAHIFTGNRAQPWAEAIGIRGNKISIVGTNQEVKRNCRRNTRIIELKGRLVAPGLIDAHTHFVNFGLSLQRVDLKNLKSLESCRQRILKAAANYAPGEWIIGRGWNEHLWEEKRPPNRFDLDNLVPNNPVMMVRVCGHSVWVNSAALALCGINRHTPDPPGARIERDPVTGEPTGLLNEMRRYIEKFIPPINEETRKKAALTAQREAWRLGITGVHSLETLREWKTLAALEKEEKLKIRIHHTIHYEELKDAESYGIRPWAGGERLWFGQVKLYADGSLGSGTALLHAPYLDNPKDKGLAVLNLPALRRRVMEAYQNGYSVAIHAIGDKAVTNSLSAIAYARKGFPGARRDRLEHVQLFRRSDLSLFRELGVVASVQPVHLSTDWPTAEKKWGIDRCRNAYAWKSLLKEGIPLQFGSDAPVEPINPLLSLQAAVLRKDSQGRPPKGWFPAERLTLKESLKAFTVIPAWCSKKEKFLGAIKPGRLADLTIFDQNLFSIPPAAWTSVNVEMTIVGGEILYLKEK